MATKDISQGNASNQDVVWSGQADPIISDANATILRSITNMRTYLGGQGYTSAQLDVMSKNDMISACRTKLGIAYK